MNCNYSAFFEALWLIEPDRYIELADLKSEEPDAAEMDEALQDIIDSAIRVSEIVRRERRLIHKSPLGPERVGDRPRRGRNIAICSASVLMSFSSGASNL